MEAKNVILKTDRTKKDADVLEGKMCFCPYFVKNLAQCLCFETIKHRIPVLKLNLKKKIKLQVKLNINNVELYAYFAT